MSNYIPNKAEHSFEETSDIVNTIGNLFQKATNGVPFNYSITDMGYTKHDEAAAIVDEEFKKAEKGEVLEAPEATKEGDELVDKMLEEAHGVTVKRPSYFFDGATVTQRESPLTDKKSEAPKFNEYGEIVRGDDQPEVNDNTIPTFTPPEPEEVIDSRSYVSNGGVFADKQPKEQEVIESHVSTNGDYNDIVSSAVNQGKETEKSYFFDNEQPSAPGKHTMVCSSYVYQCYLDASKKNPALKLNLKDADVGFKDHPLIGRKSNSKSFTLFDMYTDYVASHEEECKMNFKLKKSVAPKKLRSKEEILADLKKLVAKKVTDKVPALTLEQISTIMDIISAIKDVISALATFFKGDRVSFAEMMKIAREQQAMFVTPNDLVKHVTNANLVGMLKVERYGKDYDENWK